MPRLKYPKDEEEHALWKNIVMADDKQTLEAVHKRDKHRIRYTFGISGEKLACKHHLQLQVGVTLALASRDDTKWCGENYAKRSEIIGGEEVQQAHTWPWVVSLAERDPRRPWKMPRHFCGGTLIHERLVLTAAHCVTRERSVSKKNIKNLVVQVGAHDITSMEHGSFFVKVRYVFTHPNWSGKDSANMTNDLAVVELMRSAIRANISRAVCLPRYTGQDRPRTGENCVATGWGYGTDQYSRDSSQVLRHVVIPVMSKKRCKRYWTKYLDRSMFCAGKVSLGRGRKKGPCQGDSGGPLLCSKNGHTYTVAGITSWGYIICLKKPPVFSDVSTMTDWIKSVATSRRFKLPKRRPQRPSRRRVKTKLKRKKPKKKSPACNFSNLRITSGLKVRGARRVRPKRGKQGFTAVACVTRCCTEGAEKCGSVQYYPRKRRCEIIAKNWCDIDSREDVISTKRRGVMYIGHICDEERKKS